MNIYECCPSIEGGNFLLRLTEPQDAEDLLNVYSDKNALPFFNSDNCDGDIFYYPTLQRMSEAVSFWDYAYKNGWFVRLSIIEKKTDKAIGTAELCVRVSDDIFNNAGILRIDVASGYEKSGILQELFLLTAPKLNELLGCDKVITKVPAYAVERADAAIKAGFKKSEHLLVGKTGFCYDGYWIYTG